MQPAWLKLSLLDPSSQGTGMTITLTISKEA
ncbi:hypothetical protein WwAna0868 [Wolbachia endosymbiont of Drosophila ananassae]|nr:hypothetical protein WwAna1391 [Wolbachia endosymbiont of Drosophila ananassae]EAL58660.1 hypothetical protein WwAna0868 [Wolbachia endosymbiont of Drosophila ananassae]